ncbi:hypothetical protein C7445_11246 [Alicyclobacillus sacchari]|uniref:Photosynthesis system II assembly factor Ycf48/Hcf136-like domain-containing protein n=1 Tax=Alicyclobacillus sacchari TaxID=392010 RepID=A0A4R8LL02_9BACL|nr:hypothetical protein [Alicyclobacillus sacchari]TDY43062.1 hypothetical protein C7445_11246 [Alicyclobacillus sacchari]GMA57795.1 hypothetical protein GCM10025858_22980 [Alicyclobacillus sacchari]
MMRRTWMWALAVAATIALTGGCDTRTDGTATAMASVVSTKHTAQTAKQEAVSTTDHDNLVFSGSPDVTSTSATSVAVPVFTGGGVGYAAVNGQIIMTKNGGSTWARVGTVDGQVQSLAFANAGDGVALTRTVVPIAPANDGRQRVIDAIYRTTDGGRQWIRTWTATRVTVQSMFPQGCQVALFDQNGYALIDGVLLHTADGGATWRQVTVPGQPIDLSAPRADQLWLSITTKPASADGDISKGEIELLHSIDGGAHWTVAVRTAPMRVWEAVVQLNPSTATQGVFLVKDLDSWTTTAYWTTDGGKVWKDDQPNAYMGRILQSDPTFTKAAGGVALVALEPGAAPFPGGLTAFNTHTGAISQVVQLPDWREATLTSGPDNAVFAAVSLTNGGMDLYRSADGGKTWHVVYPAGEPNVAVQFVTPKDGVGIGSDDLAGYIYTTADGGHTWHTVRMMNGMFPTAIAYANADTVYVAAVELPNHGSEQGQLHILVSHDGGKTWTDLGRGQLPPSASAQLTVANVQTALAASGDRFALTLVTAYPSVSLQSTNGIAWKQVSSLSSPLGIAAAAYESPLDLWTSSVGQLRRPTKSQPGIYQTTLTLTAGSQIERRVLLPQGYAALGMDWLGEHGWVLAARSPFDVNQGMAMFVTDNGGRTWSHWQTRSGDRSVPQPLNEYPSGAVYDLSFVNAADGYLLTANGLLATADGGHTWQYVN